MADVVTVQVVGGFAFQGKGFAAAVGKTTLQAGARWLGHLGLLGLTGRSICSHGSPCVPTPHSLQPLAPPGLYCPGQCWCSYGKLRALQARPAATGSLRTSRTPSLASAVACLVRAALAWSADATLLAARWALQLHFRRQSVTALINFAPVVLPGRLPGAAAGV